MTWGERRIVRPQASGQKLGRTPISSRNDMSGRCGRLGGLERVARGGAKPSLELHSASALRSQSSGPRLEATSSSAPLESKAALLSVVCGLVDRPVIAVPTSVGYGATLGGLTAWPECSRPARRA